jgi:hypothetical protein
MDTSYPGVLEIPSMACAKTNKNLKNNDWQYQTEKNRRKLRRIRTKKSQFATGATKFGEGSWVRRSAPRLDRAASPQAP